jgi:hypothetical protein
VVVNALIIQAAATSLIHMQILAVTQVPHRRRKTGIFSGIQGDPGACCAPGNMYGVSVESAGVIGMVEGVDPAAARAAPK